MPPAGGRPTSRRTYIRGGGPTGRQRGPVARSGAPPDGPVPSPRRAAAAATVVAGSPSANGANQLVERTVLVRLIPRTGPFARARAVIALTIIAASIGLVLAGVLGVIVWGLAAAVHHAANN